MKYIKLFESFNKDEMKYQIDSFCNENYIRNYRINYDFSIDVQQDVHLAYERCQFDKLPIRFNYVDGDFCIYGLGLTTLDGCPKTITGYFDCSDNELTSLEFGPEDVPIYHCYDNKLTNLDFLPNQHMDELHCYKNLITEINKCPDVENFVYYDNPIFNLISFMDCFSMNHSIDEIIDKINEFEVIKDHNKLDMISIDSLYDFYNKKPGRFYGEKESTRFKNIKGYELI